MYPHPNVIHQGVGTQTRCIAALIGTFSAVFLLSASISSLVFSVKSWNRSKDSNNALKHQIQHWESLPLIDVDIIDKSESCKDGWETPIWSPYDRNALQTIGQFPGSLPWCECGKKPGFQRQREDTRCDCGPGKKTHGDEGTTYYTTYWGSGFCSEEQRRAECVDDTQNFTEYWTTRSGYCNDGAIFAGCANDIPLPPKDLPIWKHNKKLCYKRGGWNTLQRIAALDIDDAYCLRGVTCHHAKTGEDPSRTICAPTQEECPIVYLGDLDTAMAGTDTLLKLTEDAVTGDSLPIIEIQTTIGHPCWKGTWGDGELLKSQAPSEASPMNSTWGDGELLQKSNNERVANEFNSECWVKDYRYVKWDSIMEPILYRMNDVGTSGNVSMAGDGKSNFSGTRSEIQYYDTNYALNWTLWYRQEISWDSTCAAGTISDLLAHLEPIKKLIKHQENLFIVELCLGLLTLGIGLPVVFIVLGAGCCWSTQKGCCWSTQGMQAYARAHGWVLCLSSLCLVAKMIALIVCMVKSSGIQNFFALAADWKCSDDLTNQEMIELSSNIDENQYNNRQILYINIIIICWDVLFVIWLMSKCSQANQIPPQQRPPPIVMVQSRQPYSKPYCPEMLFPSQSQSAAPAFNSTAPQAQAQVAQYPYGIYRNQNAFNNAAMVVPSPQALRPNSLNPHQGQSIANYNAQTMQHQSYGEGECRTNI